MAITRADETDLLLPLYEGLHEPRPWATFLTRVRQRVRADEAQLVISAGAQGEETCILVPASATEADDRAWRRSLRPGRAYRMEGPNRFGQIVRVDEPGGVTAWLSIRRKERDFSAADAALLARLAPHLSIALRTRSALDQAQGALALSEAALQRAGIGWVGFGADARVLAMSEGAAGALGARWAAGAISNEIVAAAEGTAVRLERIRDEAPFWMLLVPWQAPSQVAWALPAVIGLVLLPAPSDPAARAAVLGTLFSLPPSEARLAAALAGGASLHEAAAQLGITIETARNYSKRLFAKTRARGQVDLVRMIGDSLARFV
ncbi:helix-turn-helix transcriptional regulator [Sphingomonas mucosissima]|uniref:HTH luxR-type domain-containing protein n=1 Tax=Sphingomonas mucosissima TaxID=370959 RepID=A0A245ZHG3_9SPHN|nr:hypothetical protein [Sphingomonas mucosissima]OWK29173.1 hypothetical protein SPMU_27000 [Sphingomonas mucosissima]